MTFTFVLVLCALAAYSQAATYGSGRLDSARGARLSGSLGLSGLSGRGFGRDDGDFGSRFRGDRRDVRHDNVHNNRYDAKRLVNEHVFNRPGGIISGAGGRLIAPGAIGGVGIAGGSSCLYSEFPSSCSRARGRNTIRRYTFSNGVCRQFTSSRISSFCQPRNEENNVFRSLRECQLTCQGRGNLGGGHLGGGHLDGGHLGGGQLGGGQFDGGHLGGGHLGGGLGHRH